MLHSTTAMITFALFMISEIYCKLKPLEGNDLQLQRFVDDIYSEKATKYFSFNPFGEALTSVLEEQKSCRKKAADKLPGWIEAKCLFATTPLEQATSESVAKVKAALFGGETMLSLTGGLGVDDAAFSKSFGKIKSIDTDACLNSLVRLNYKLLGCHNIDRIDTSAEAFLASQNEVFEFFYCDPDRRPGGHRQASDARQYSPNVFELFHRYRESAKMWLIKLSPMTDLTWIRRQFNQPCRIYILYFKREIKELLVQIGMGTPDKNMIVQVDDDGKFVVFEETDLQAAKQCDFDVFCELSAASIKAGFGQSLAKTFQWKGENSGTYFTGRYAVSPALARCFKLIETLEGSLAEMGEKLKEMGVSQAHISAREFVADAETVRKKLRLKDGGEYYLFFTGKGSMKKGFVCRKAD